jgi:hypothetical protein
MANVNFQPELNSRHISTNLTNYEAARNAFFTLNVDFHVTQGPDKGRINLLKPDYTGDPAAAEATDYIEGADEGLRLNVTKAPVPHFSIGTEEFRRGNDVVKFATIPTWDAGTIEVDDVVGIRTKDILMAWQYLAYNTNTRLGGRMRDYKKTCTLCEYTQDYELVRTWTLEGCFITKLSEGDFDRENDGKRKITAEISYDRATVENNYETI